MHLYEYRSACFAKYCCKSRENIGIRINLAPGPYQHSLTRTSFKHVIKINQYSKGNDVQVEKPRHKKTQEQGHRALGVEDSLSGFVMKFCLKILHIKTNFALIFGVDA